MGTRIDGEDEVGRARRFDAATRGGGMSEVVGLGGGAMRVGLLGCGGGAMPDNDGALEARCAEFMAGKEGGGRSSSSSSSSELSCLLSVKVGTAGASPSGTGVAFGVDSRDRLIGVPPLSSCFVEDCSSMLCSSVGALSCFWPCCDFSATVCKGACVTRVMKASHVDGGRL